MAGNTKRIQVALEHASDRVLGQVGIPEGDSYRVLNVTGAMVIGALQGGDDLQARLEASHALLRRALPLLEGLVEVLSEKPYGGGWANPERDKAEALAAELHALLNEIPPEAPEGFQGGTISEATLRRTQGVDEEGDE